MKKIINDSKFEILGDQDMSESGIYEGEHLISYCEKKWFEHIWDLRKYIYGEIFSFFVLVGLLWGFIQVFIAASGNNAAVGEFAFPVIMIAVLLVFYKAYLNYRSYAPEELINESDAVKYIFWKQNCGWQFKLAWQMLSDRVDRIDLTLERIKTGAEFIEPIYLSSKEYYNWLESRPEALKRLIHAAMIQCTMDIPSILKRTSAEEHLPELKARLIALIQLYEYTMKYEIECHKIVPQEPYSELHELTYGWTNPIQKSINEFMQILHTLGNVDRKLLIKGEVCVPNFNIDINAPDNIEEFCNKLNDIITKSRHQME